MGDAIAVLIVERETLFQRGLVGCLGADPAVRVVGSAGTAAEAYRLADELLPDVALVGTALPDAPGLAAAAELHRRFPALAAVVVAETASDEALFAAIRAGAAACVGRDVAEDALLALVRRAAAGEYPINEQLLASPSLAARVLEQFRAAAGPTAAPAVFAPLTGRELQVLKGARDGMTNAAIGEALGISDQTVKNHLSSILRKLAVNDRTQAVVLELRRGWLAIDEEPASVGGGAGALPVADGGRR